jgi:hypothetical protein
MRKYLGMLFLGIVIVLTGLRTTVRGQEAVTRESQSSNGSSSFKTRMPRTVPKPAGLWASRD